MVGWINMKLGTEVRLGPGHIVLDGDPDLPPQKGHNPPFSAHVCCGQTAGWINMPLPMEVGLGPGHIVLDGDPASPKKGNSTPPLFVPCLLWPNSRPSQLLLSTCWFCTVGLTLLWLEVNFWVYIKYLLFYKLYCNTVLVLKNSAWNRQKLVIERTRIFQCNRFHYAENRQSPSRFFPKVTSTNRY